jgi:hypothetical protein
VLDRRPDHLWTLVEQSLQRPAYDHGSTRCTDTWSTRRGGLLPPWVAACDRFLLDKVFAPGNGAGERDLAAGMAMLDHGP